MVTSQSILILMSLSFLYFLENYDRYLLATSWIPYIDYYSYQYSLLSGIIFSICYSAGGVAIAFVMDSFTAGSISTKVKVITISICCFIFSFSLMMSVVAINFYQLCLIRISMGLAQSIVTPFSISILDSHFNHNNKGFAFSFYQLGIYFAFSLSLSLGTYMYDKYGWKSGYLFFGIVGIFYSIIIFLVLLPSTDSSSTESNVSNVIAMEKTNDTNLYAQVCIDEESKHEKSDEKVVSVPTFVSGEVVCKDNEYHSILLCQNNSEPAYSPLMSIEDYNQTNTSFIQNDEINCFNSSLESSRIETTIDCKAFELDQVLVNSKSNSIESAPKSADSTEFIDSSKPGQIFKLWKNNPFIVGLCLAAGIRIGAGYIWAAYTALFFSDFWISESSNDAYIPCVFSYNQSISTLDPLHKNVSIACNRDYPYCVETFSSKKCCKISSSPWHNVGMPHKNLEMYMAWVPIIGSGLGSIIGGILSDKLVVVWGNRARSWVCASGCFLAAPFVYLSLNANFPLCFIYLAVSGLFGEAYLSQSLALLVDYTPKQLTVSSIALFSFFFTLLGGNAPSLVPALIRIFSDKTHNDVGNNFKFYAAPQIGSLETELTNNLKFYDVMSFSQSSSLQNSLIFSLLSLYICSGLLYIFCSFIIPAAVSR
jgi:MFS family permease